MIGSDHEHNNSEHDFSDAKLSDSDSDPEIKSDDDTDDENEDDDNDKNKTEDERENTPENTEQKAEGEEKNEENKTPEPEPKAAEATKEAEDEDEVKEVEDESEEEEDPEELSDQAEDTESEEEEEKEPKGEQLKDEDFARPLGPLNRRQTDGHLGLGDGNSAKSENTGRPGTAQAALKPPSPPTHGRDKSKSSRAERRKFLYREVERRHTEAQMKEEVISDDGGRPKSSQAKIDSFIPLNEEKNNNDDEESDDGQVNRDRAAEFERPVLPMQRERSLVLLASDDEIESRVERPKTAPMKYPKGSQPDKRPEDRARPTRVQTAKHRQRDSRNDDENPRPKTAPKLLAEGTPVENGEVRQKETPTRTQSAKPRKTPRQLKSDTRPKTAPKLSADRIADESGEVRKRETPTRTQSAKPSKTPRQLEVIRPDSDTRPCSSPIWNNRHPAFGRVSPLRTVSALTNEPVHRPLSSGRPPSAPVDKAEYNPSNTINDGGADQSNERTLSPTPPRSKEEIIEEEEEDEDDEDDSTGTEASFTSFMECIG